MKRYLLFVIACLTISSVRAQNDVELVVSNGIHYVANSAFSHDNRLVAECASSNVYIWDVATGRLLRKVYFTNKPNVYADTLWFNQDNSKLIVKPSSSMDEYHVDVATGKTEYFPKEMDWTKYKYQMSLTMKCMNFRQIPGKGEKIIPCPDGNSELILKKVPHPFAVGPDGYTLEIRIKSGGKVSPPLDSADFVTVAFSDDHKYLYIDHRMYDIKKQKEVAKFHLAPNKANGVGFIPGTRIPVTAGVEGIVIWDFPNIRTLNIPWLSQFRWINGGEQMLIEIVDPQNNAFKYAIYDYKNDKLSNIPDKAIKMQYLNDATPDGKYVSVSYNEVDPKTYQPTFYSSIVDVATNEATNVDGAIRTYFTGDNDVVILEITNDGFYTYNRKTKEKKPFAKEENSLPRFPMWSYDDRYLFVMQDYFGSGEYNRKMKFYDRNTLEVKREFPLEIGADFSASLSKDESVFAIYSYEYHNIQVYDMATNKLKWDLRGHTDAVFHTKISDDGKRLLSNSMDGTVKLWNLETGKLMVSMVTAGKNEFAIINPDQYYFSTRGAQSMIHFVRGKEIFPFEQFDLKYNRPDIILESLEASNQDLKEPFNLAYLKRLKRLGYTEDMLSGEFHMPKMNISNKDELPILSEQKDLTLQIHGIDSKYMLDRLLVRVNGVPIHGKLGLDLKDKGSQYIKKDISVRLSSGPNRISVSVMNEKGVESIASTVDVEYHDPNAPLPKLYLITMGVSKYADSQFDLNYAAKDAGDIKTMFSGQHLPFSDVISVHLENDQVTPEAISEVRKKLENSTEDDVVCVFFAGHGLLDANLDYFLAAHGVNFQNPAEGGIPYDNIEGLVDGIPARKKMVMIDACHSGEIDKDEIAWAEGGSDNSETEEDDDVDFRAVTTTGFKQVGLTNSFDLMKVLFADIRKSSGTLIISSAGGTEYAMEGSDWNNGVFTYSLLNGVKSGQADLNKDGVVMVGEINKYVRKKVVELTNGRQTPTNRTEILDLDWRMW